MKDGSSITSAESDGKWSCVECADRPSGQMLVLVATRPDGEWRYVWKSATASSPEFGTVQFAEGFAGLDQLVLAARDGAQAVCVVSPADFVGTDGFVLRALDGTELERLRHLGSLVRGNGGP